MGWLTSGAKARADLKAAIAALEALRHPNPRPSKKGARRVEVLDIDDTVQVLQNRPAELTWTAEGGCPHVARADGKATIAALEALPKNPFCRSKRAGHHMVTFTARA